MMLLLRSLVTVAFGVLMASQAAAQSPSPEPAQASVLRLIVPFTPGTGIDMIARTVGPKLGERLGRTVVVDNRPGASGNIGTEAVVRAAPNGSTLLVSVATLVMNRGLYPNLPFDPVNDLMPVTLTSWGQWLLVAHPRSGYKTVADLIAEAKRRPGRINYASPGVGTPHHLSMELFKSTAGVFLTHIPYRGTAPAVTDLLSGQIEVMFLPIHVALAQVNAGKLVPLGIGSDQRHALLPDVPTLAEAGGGKINIDVWYGIFAPAGTAPELVSQLNREVKEILGTSEVRAVFKAQGMEPATSTPEEFKRLVEHDAERWAQLIKERNIRPE